MFSGLRAMAKEPESRILLAAAGTTLAVGTVGYMLLEHWSPVDALYFCVVTLATVGFGDLHPTTEISRLFTIGYILVGVGILAGFISELAKYRAGIVAGRARFVAAKAQDEPPTEPES
jgi:voltage-gated potassium channel